MYLKVLKSTEDTNGNKTLGGSKLQYQAYTLKKAFRYSRPQPGCHLPNSPWAGMMTS